LKRKEKEKKKQWAHPNKSRPSQETTIIPMEAFTSLLDFYGQLTSLHFKPHPRIALALT